MRVCGPTRCFSLAWSVGRPRRGRSSIGASTASSTAASRRSPARFPGSLGSDDVREIYAQFLLSGISARDMHKLRTFAPERGNKLSSWIGMLATNAAWDHLRTLARAPQPATLSEAETMPAPAADPYEQLLERERWSKVSDALQTFSEKDQTFVRLYYMDGLSPEEVAEEMQISVKTVYSKKHKIRSRLERALQPMMREVLNQAA
jgi:RNA polymerase sigma-70 factor (ECF subfamily)